MTGLPTRPLFVNQVRRALSRARRRGSPVFLFAIDLDGFRHINEQHGYGAGDMVLATVATRLRDVLRIGDVLGLDTPLLTRLCADEFLLVCENVVSRAAADAIAARIVARISEPVSLPSGSASLSASVGIAMSRPESTADQLILEAEEAQRDAGRGGGGRHEFFTPELHDRAVVAAEMVAALRNAVANDELRLLYQPKISLVTNRVVAVEALLRWARPDHGLVMPDEFIPTAEACGAIAEIGQWVLVNAARQAAAWRTAFPRVPLQLAVNVSPRQFDGRFGDAIRTTVEACGLDASAICLEMIESTGMEDIDRTVEILGRLKRLGFSVSIDDFGTGYSSLEYLHRLPIDEIKIDRAFVGGLGVDPGDTAIVASVISLAHAMGLEVVAEGVETTDQLERLRTLGCDFAQGFLIAGPVPAEAIDEYLAADAAGERPAGFAPDIELARLSRRATVLVVDGDSDVRAFARMNLTAAGLAVEEAGSGAAAIALSRRIKPDCVLLELDLSDMCGIDACRVLRGDAATADCAIVVLTTRADAADKAEAFLSDADDYIVKPCSPRDLVSRIHAALRRRATAVETLGRQVDAALLDMLRLQRRVAVRNLASDIQLSDRQIEIVTRLAGGQRVPGIARDLFLSQSTIRNHLSAVYHRFGVHSQEELLTVLRNEADHVERDVPGNVVALPGGLSRG